MHLGLLIYGSLDTISGGYLYDRKVVEYLRRQGDQVELISLPWRSYTRHLGDNLSPALLRQLARSPLELLIQDELNHPSLFWVNRRLKAQHGYPLVSLVHHLRSSESRSQWHNKFYRWVERLYLSSVDGFIFNSQTTRTAVEKVSPLLHHRPSVVAYPAGNRFGPAMDPAEITRRALLPGPLRVFFLGNIIPRKGLDTLLSALHRLPREDWILNVAGSLGIDRSYAQSIRRQIERDGLSGQVRLLGPLAERELEAKLRSCQILVVPSTYEGFGIVYLEGMGFGLPAIGTTRGAAGEIITHGKDGFLIPPGDAQVLAAHLSELTNNRQRLAELSLSARQRFEAHPTWEQTAERIRNFLCRLVEKGQGRP